MHFQTQLLGCLLLILGNFLVILYLSLHEPSAQQQPLDSPKEANTATGVQCNDRPRVGHWVPPEARLTNISWILEPQLAFDTTPYLPLLDPTLPSIMEDELQKFVNEVWKAGYRSLAELANSTFYALLNESKFTVFADKSVFVQTGRGMSLKEASLMAHALIPFSLNDQRIQHLIEGLLAKMFQFLPYSPHASEFRLHPKAPLTIHRVSQGENYYAFPPHFSYDLLFPFWLAHDYFELTGTTSIFTQRFHCSCWTLTDIIRNEMNNTEPFFHSRLHISRPNKMNLTWSAYRATGNEQKFPFNIPTNVFAHHVLALVSEIADLAFNDTALTETALELQQRLESGIRAHGVVRGSLGEMLAFEVDGCGQTIQEDEVAVPSLLSLPFLSTTWFPAFDQAGQLYATTRRWIFTSLNPNKQGHPLRGQPRPSRAHLDSLLLFGITSNNETEILEVAKRLAELKESLVVASNLQLSVTEGPGGALTRSLLLEFFSGYYDVLTHTPLRPGYAPHGQADGQFLRNYRYLRHSLDPFTDLLP